MAITFDNAGTATYDTSTGTATFAAYPTNIAANDVLVLFVGRSASAITIPGGYTAFTGAQKTTTGGTTMILAWKLATGSESGTLSVTCASGVGFSRFFLFKGVHTTTTEDVTASSAAANATTTALPSITTVTAGACLIAAGTDAGSVNVPTSIDDGNFTEIFDVADGNHNARNGAIYYWVSGAAGASGTKTMTHDNARAVGIMGALRPAAAAATDPIYPATAIRRT